MKGNRANLFNRINYNGIFLQMKEVQYIQTKNENGKEAMEIN